MKIPIPDNSSPLSPRDFGLLSENPEGPPLVRPVGSCIRLNKPNSGSPPNSPFRQYHDETSYFFFPHRSLTIGFSGRGVLQRVERGLPKSPSAHSQRPGRSPFWIIKRHTPFFTPCDYKIVPPTTSFSTRVFQLKLMLCSRFWLNDSLPPLDFTLKIFVFSPLQPPFPPVFPPDLIYSLPPTGAFTPKFFDVFSYLII